MDDAGHRRDDAEVAEGLLAPLEELVAFAVALEFHLGVALEGIGSGEEIHLDRVVDDQVDRHERVDLLRVAAQAGDRRAHGSQVHHRRDAGEILHDHPRRQEGNARATGRARGRRPGGNILHILRRDLLLIALTQGRFEHDADREWQAAEFGQAGFFQRIEAEDDVFLVSHFQHIAGLK